MSAPDESATEATSTPEPTQPTRQTQPTHRRRWPRVLAIIVAVVVAIGLVLVFALYRELSRPIPPFASLQQAPDNSVTGTVAFVAPSGCVTIISASGRPAKEVYCIPAMDIGAAKTQGKELGPQLVWLKDGRLEVTMFRMTEPPGPNYRAGWQRIVDVRTGKVTEVPAARVPSQPNLSTRPTRDPAGRAVSFTSDPADGTVSVSLTTAGSTQSLMKAQGPPNYTYGLDTAFWSPDFRWIAADDGRILVITPGSPAQTRVLATRSTSGGFGGSGGQQATFAITSKSFADLTG